MIEMEKITNKITVECKKVKKFCKDKLMESENKTAEEPKKDNPFRMNTNENPKRGIPYTPHQIDDQNLYDGNHGQTKKVIFSENMLPKQNTNNMAFVYAIHVSKFDADKKVEDIVEHVMQNTTIIDPDNFKVVKLNNTRSDFSSFKISTYTNEIYDEIKSIWAPYFYVRDFRQNNNNASSRMKQNSGYKVRNFANETPTVSFKHKHRYIRNEDKQRERTDRRPQTINRGNM